MIYRDKCRLHVLRNVDVVGGARGKLKGAAIITGDTHNKTLDIYVHTAVTKSQMQDLENIYLLF